MTLQIISDEVKDKLRLLVDARRRVEELEAAAAKAKDERDELELDVFEMFTATDDSGEPAVRGTIAVPLGDGYGTIKFRTRATHYAKVADEEKLRAYYAEQGTLNDVMTDPKWVMKELNSDVREVLDKPDGKLPPGMTYYTKRGMTITEQKSA